MLTEASKTLSFEPSTSLHSTGTSAVSILNLLQRKNNSTSNANLSIWSVSKSCFAAYLVNSLNPHWVSWVFMPNNTVMINLKTALTNLLWNFLWTLPSSSKCLLEPTTIAKGWPFYFTIYSSFCQTGSRPEKVVAPSASTISILSPCATDIPALTAPPFPLFLGY